MERRPAAPETQDFQTPDIRLEVKGESRCAEWAVIGAFSLAIVLWISREAWKAEAPKAPGASWPLGALVTDALRC